MQVHNERLSRGSSAADWGDWKELRHLDEELEQLKSLLLERSALVETAIYRSILAVVEKSEDQSAGNRY